MKVRLAGRANMVHTERKLDCHLHLREIIYELTDNLSSAASNFASSQDMAKIGRSMLRSSLLSPVVTKRWLKPTSFIEDFAQGVGLAWEIYRAKVDKHSVDIYSKGGDSKWSLFISACLKGDQLT
jgi:hypothetical protein